MSKRTNMDAVANGLEGIIEGLGINYFWEALRLPGYGVPVPGVPPYVGPAGSVGLGVDDLVPVAIGAGVAVYGNRVEKNPNTVIKGIGIVAGGLGVAKVIELIKAAGLLPGNAVARAAAPAPTANAGGQAYGTPGSQAGQNPFGAQSVAGRYGMVTYTPPQMPWGQQSPARGRYS